MKSRNKNTRAPEGYQLLFVHTEGLTEDPPASAPCIPSGMLSIRLTAHHCRYWKKNEASFLERR
jgi:hypothetical protein